MATAMQIFEQAALKLKWQERRAEHLESLHNFFKDWAGEWEQFPETHDWLCRAMFRVKKDGARGVVAKMDGHGMQMGWVNSRNDTEPGWFSEETGEVINVTADNIEEAFATLIEGFDIRSTDPSLD